MAKNPYLNTLWNKPEGGPTAGSVPRRPAANPNVNPNTFLQQSYAGNRNPLEHQAWWAQHGWVFKPGQNRFVQKGAKSNLPNPNPVPGHTLPGQTPPIVPYPEGTGPAGGSNPGAHAGEGQGGGGGGGGNGQGQGGGNNGGQGQGQGNGLNRDEYDQLMQKLGLPLDPMYEATRTNLLNARDALLQQLQSQYNVGGANLDLQSVLGNRAIDENTAARGLYGSGIERRGERLLGNDIGQQRLGLLSQFQSGQLGANADYRGQMMQALQALAARLQGQQNLPLPEWGPWANLGQGG